MNLQLLCMVNEKSLICIRKLKSNSFSQELVPFFSKQAKNNNRIHLFFQNMGAIFSYYISIKLGLKDTSMYLPMEIWMCFSASTRGTLYLSNFYRSIERNSSH